MNRARATGKMWKSEELEGLARSICGIEKSRYGVYGRPADLGSARRLFRRRSLEGSIVSHDEALTMVAEANALIKYVKLLADQSGAQ